MTGDIALPDYFYLSSATNKGLIFDGLWKASLEGFTIPPESDAPYDAELNGEYFDVKIIPHRDTERPTLNVYISHNEYLFGKEHNTRFFVYREVASTGKFLCLFTFEYAKEIGAITLFDQGKKVHCKQTGKSEAPWSIDVTRILQKSTPPI